MLNDEVNNLRQARSYRPTIEPKHDKSRVIDTQSSSSSLSLSLGDTSVLFSIRRSTVEVEHTINAYRSW